MTKKTGSQGQKNNNLSLRGTKQSEQWTFGTLSVEYRLLRRLARAKKLARKGKKTKICHGKERSNLNNEQLGRFR
ncbi:MAG: hypothetical protein ACPG5B_14040 [Chitinophagales bacterium]